jgi:bifunctional non-homologous end joining protein LigD
MKATLSGERQLDRSEWVFERKLDGVRCLAAAGATGVALRSRTNHDLRNSYPELVAALERFCDADVVLDGEIVAFAGRHTSFELLQRRMQISDPRRAALTGVRVDLCIFDLLRLDGCDTTRLPLLTRKRLLRGALGRIERPLRFVSHKRGDAQELLDRACVSGWEGLIAKRAKSPYRQTRSSDWLKLKCSARQELVIGGFTAPRGSRQQFGALLVGYFDADELRYAGKVGTGFSQRTLSELGARLRGLERRQTPFASRDLPRDARWVEPELVAEIEFSEWTRAGRLRQPRFVGLREDKNAREVVREQPQ